jgi:hypothetical protein
MRFGFFRDELIPQPKLSVDGLVPGSLHLSHWSGNRTPSFLKADSSTEIVLNLLRSPERTGVVRGVNLVTNNHFDTDGLLSVWASLRGEDAVDLTDRLIAAAEAGDFSSYTTDLGVRVSLAIQGTDADGGWAWMALGAA